MCSRSHGAVIRVTVRCSQRLERRAHYGLLAKAFSLCHAAEFLAQDSRGIGEQSPVYTSLSVIG